MGRKLFKHFCSGGEKEMGSSCYVAAVGSLRPREAASKPIIPVRTAAVEEKRVE
jgi:hypothetical protein